MSTEARFVVTRNYLSQAVGADRMGAGANVQRSLFGKKLEPPERVHLRPMLYAWNDAVEALMVYVLPMYTIT